VISFYEKGRKIGKNGKQDIQGQGEQKKKEAEIRVCKAEGSIKKKTSSKWGGCPNGRNCTKKRGE